MSLPDLQTGGVLAGSVTGQRLLSVIAELAKELQRTTFDRDR